MNDVPPNFFLAVPIRGLPVRGLFLLTVSGRVLPGLLFNDPHAAQLVADQLNAQSFDEATLTTLAQDPARLRAVVGALAQNALAAWLPSEVHRLLDLLRAIGWNQAKLARKLDIDPNTVSRWITGRTPVPHFALEYLEALKAVKVLAEKLEL